MKNLGDVGAEPRKYNSDEFEEFYRMHPERCVELTQAWKESLLKTLAAYLQKSDPNRDQTS